MSNSIIRQQNLVTDTPQLLKPKKFSPLVGLEGGFEFLKVTKIWFDPKISILIYFKLENYESSSSFLLNYHVFVDVLFRVI